MNNQLPAETMEAIELKAEHEAALHFHPVYSPDQNTACLICYRNGAKEYATRMLQVEQENARLNDQAQRQQDKNKTLSEYYRELQEKCDRYEAALKEIAELNRPLNDDTAILIAVQSLRNEALSAGEGDNNNKNKI